ncbi:hypothetical protein N5C36_12520 [Shewanella xiamenensis]|uniref:hypothetical protein n=1 Tax=Shewanella TaxID=22 RepID=UPI000B341594|nr:MULTISPECIES: hypothetical protein [Shewanella]QXN27282.1 hypothetical protein KVP08_021475 [Shewanella putrefaciens]MBW0282189.1 hypothetical protein [Shewanella xiamenensis]MCB2384179.1 hypothetical protein [Shewanella sp. SR1]MDH0450782.1 hypothetical protein [Shewanella sp. GD04112]MDH1314906.1 hypothetical protein [Shewanella xiamenensis]
MSQNGFPNCPTNYVDEVSFFLEFQPIPSKKSTGEEIHINGKNYLHPGVKKEESCSVWRFIETDGERMITSSHTDCGEVLGYVLSRKSPPAGITIRVPFDS